MKHFLIPVLFAVGAAGCVSSAGPFITRLRVAGPGQLVVDKCTVEFSTVPYNHVENTECTSEILYLPVPNMGPPSATAPQPQPSAPAS